MRGFKYISQHPAINLERYAVFLEKGRRGQAQRYSPLALIMCGLVRDMRIGRKTEKAFS